MARTALHLLVVAALVGCAPADPIDDDAESEDALASHAISGYAAVVPAERVVTTAPLRVQLGEPIVAGRRLMILRRLVFRGAPAKLVVDADSMITALVADSALDQGARAARPTDALDQSPFASSLATLAASDATLASIDADAPLAAAEPFALTIDMCQSRRLWDAKLFEWAVALSNQLGKPVPVGIAMTGGWAKAHPDELGRIDAWAREGKLAITWINHSSTHPLHCRDASCARAEFLTASGVDFDEEVMGLERSLLARGLLPSVLFRFPGLVHDARRRGQLSRLSLMPLDADAWIAKGQPIKPRGVVLVHGNGNEPPGITRFLSQVETRADALRAGRSALVSPLLAAPTPPR
ncbi:MAG: hypothetical protein KF819_10655 [Labilithrix sp.]|nr:hypothetical protein [Labilithrix sp.]